mgnify:CR=1 FL=1
MLNKIIENKKREVELAKKNFPLSRFKNKLEKSSRNFKEALLRKKLSLIAEIKRVSPSQNVISQKNALSFSPKRFFEIIKIYNRYADAISVLTDKKFFSGSLEDLRNVSRMTNLPVLRKEFIIDEYQIYEARLYGADAVLLIASVLPQEQINDFIAIAGSLNMECLVEVNNSEELQKVLGSEANIIGINNRNLNTLEIDMNTTPELLKKIPKSKIIVSESGITNKDYLRKIEGKVNAILVGALFMNSTRLEEEISSLIQLESQDDKSKNMRNYELWRCG